MTLTKEDLAAIGSLIDEKLEAKLEAKLNAKLPVIEEMMERKLNAKLPAIEEMMEGKLAPIRETQKELLKAQYETVKKIDFMQFQMDGLKTDFYSMRHQINGFQHELIGIKLDVERLKAA